MSKEFELEGLDEILDNLDLFTDTKQLERSIKKACAVVERAAKQKAPKGSGDLRRSISSRVQDLEGVVYTPLEYAPYVEFGTGLFAEKGGRKEVPWVYVEGSSSSGNKSTKTYTEEEARETVAFLRSKGLEAYMTYGEKPHPYMRPALYENREKILRILKEGLTNND